MATSSIRDYRDLLAWQRAVDLALGCETVCDELPETAANLSMQIRRSANAVHANIAEGNGRFSRPDYIRHLSSANGSLREVESRLHFVQRKFGPSRSLNTALDLCVVVAKLLTGLVRSLRKKTKG